MKTFSSVVAISSVTTLFASAQQIGVESELYSDGTLKWLKIPVPHVSQLTRDNCGPCTVNMALAAEAYKRVRRGTGMKESQMKKLLDSDLSGGVNLDEMETGIEKAAASLSRHLKLTSTNTISESWRKEADYTSSKTSASTTEMSSGLSNIQYWMLRSKSSVLLQGNMDLWWRSLLLGTPWDGRGDHWYATWVYGNALDKNNKKLPFIFVMDSVYKSSAFPSSIQSASIPPTTMIFNAKLKDIWRPTGPSKSPALNYIVNTKRPN